MNNVDQELEEHFKLLRPSDCLGVFSDEPDRRFRGMDKGFREKVVEAMKWEDTQLRKYIDKCRLEEWAKTTNEAARDAVDGLMDKVIAERMETVGGDDEMVIM